MNLSKQKRQSLDRRANRLLERLRGTIVASPSSATPRECAILVTETTRPHIMRRALIQPALHSAGMHLEGLDELLAEVAADPKDDGQRYPVIILIDGWAQVAFIECPTLSQGGQA